MIKHRKRKLKKKKEDGGERKKSKFGTKNIKKLAKNVTQGVTNLFKSEKDQIVVGGPKNFRHASHIGWGENGFSITDLPAEWLNLFKKAGVKKSELQDKETAQYILGVISDAMYSEGMVNAPIVGMGSSNGESNTSSDNSGAPPPPPPPKINAPVPPPPPPPGFNAPPPGSNIPNPPGNSPPSNSSAGSSNFLEELQQKKNVLSSKPEASAIPDLKNISETQESSLVNTLAFAMRQIRQDVDDSQEEGNDGWSDEE
jgi:hypothetical protein